MPALLLALDPGGTTGWALFKEGQLIDSGQVPGQAVQLQELIQSHKPTQVVAESYQIYAHKLKQHTNSTVPTLRLIGALEFICDQERVHLAFQKAAQAKQFATDERLKGWGMYVRGVHARDAVRHGAHYLLFSK